MKLGRRRIVTAALVAASGGAARGVAAQQIRFFRIGAAGTAGTYYPLAGLIAAAVSHPPGSRDCKDGGSCGVANLIATVVSTNGSVDNIDGMARGSLESGFSQSDVAYWAYSGTGVYDGRPRMDGLRAIANLYAESVHLVARKGSGIRSVADLRGKRVSLDEPGSGSMVHARLILAAYGLEETDITVLNLKPQQAADRLKEGLLDAFISVAGYPQGAIAELAASGRIELVPIDGPEVDALLARQRFFARSRIPDNAYRGVAGVGTVSVNAQWVTTARQPDDLIYGIVQALWTDNTRRLLDSGHAKGREVRLATALAGIAIPLHDGAARFYRERGMLK